MNEVKRSEFSDSIIFTKILDDSILVAVDTTTTVRYLDIDTLKIKSGFKLNILHDRYETNKVDFTSDGKYFVVLNEDCRESRLYNAERKKIVSIMNRHQGEISCVSIDPKNRYVLSGGEDGKIFVVDIKSGQHAYNLPSHADTVNDIVYSSGGQMVATAGYDKKISIYSLVTMKQKFILRGHNSPIVKLHFLRQNRLFSVDKRSIGIIWDINLGKIIKRLDGIHDDITEATTSSDGLFLFLGSKLGYIMVFDLNTYELIEKRYLKFNHAITSLNYDESNNHLIVCTKGGEVVFYDIYSGEKYINELLRKKKYDEIESYVSQNQLLKYTKSYNTMVDIWEETLAKSKVLFGKNDKENAIKLFSDFISIPKRKNILTKLLKEYEEFEKLIYFVNHGKIALAYGLVNKYPSYKESAVYNAMQKKWKSSFAMAQKYILQPRGYDKAKDILAPYRGISEKTVFIQGLLSNADVHKRFKTAIGKKDFKLCYELLKQHPYLTEYSEYDALVKYADSLYENIQILVKKGDTHGAIKLIEILLNFDSYKEEAQEILKDIEDKQRFFTAIENDDLISAYNLLDTNDALENTEDGKRLQKKWDEDIDIADNYASKGDIDNVTETLSKYLKIDSKIIAISTIVSWCYITQLKNSIRDRQDSSLIENGIKNYVLYYGLTEQIFTFYEQYKITNPTTKLTLDSLAEGSIDKWRPSMIVKSILY